MFAWVHKDAPIKRVDAEIDSDIDDAATLTHEVRHQREAVVTGDVLAVERDESALIWQAQAESLPVGHRADIDVVALPGLAPVAAPAFNSSPRTSPGHAFEIVQPGLRR